MVIQDWHLVRKLHTLPVENYMKPIGMPFKVGQSDFVIVGDEKGWHLANLDDGNVQLLVKCQSYGDIINRNGDRFNGTGFSITTEEGKGFDFHFTSRKEEDREKWFNYHHRLPFRKDIIDVLSKCGKIPSSSLQDYVDVI